MNVTVRVFAGFAEALGANAAVVTLPDAATVADLRAAVARLAPSMPPRPLIAVNAQYASDDTPISALDELAVIPPVAGG